MKNEEAIELALAAVKVSKEKIANIQVFDDPSLLKRKGLLVAIELNLEMDPNDLLVEVYENPSEIVVRDML